MGLEEGEEGGAASEGISGRDGFLSSLTTP